MSPRRIKFQDGSFKEVRTSYRESGKVTTIGSYTKEGVLKRVDYYRVYYTNEIYRSDEYKDGEKCKETWYRPNQTEEKIIEYKDNGRVTKTVYDELGNIISSSEHVNGKITRDYEYTKPTSEVIGSTAIRSTKYDENGLPEITNWVITKKDQFGREVEEKYTISYNNGVKTSAIYYYADGTKKIEYAYFPSKTLEYTYAKDGKLNKFVEITREGITKCEETYEYPNLYDKIIKTTKFADLDYPRKYTNTTRRVNDIEKIDKIECIEKYYDGRKQKSTVYDGNRTVKRKYDDSGEKVLIEKEKIEMDDGMNIKYTTTKYDSDGVVTMIKIYYDYDNKTGESRQFDHIYCYNNIGGVSVISKSFHYLDLDDNDEFVYVERFFEDGKLIREEFYSDIYEKYDYMIEYENELPIRSYRYKLINGVMTLYSTWEAENEGV